jgi:hypothetical protein
MQAGLLGDLRYTNSEFAHALDIGYSFGLWLGAQMWTLDHQAQQILAAISVSADRVNRSLSARRIEYRLTSQKQDPLGQEMIRKEVLETLRNRMSSNHRAFALIAMAFACFSILDGANNYPENQRNLVSRLAKLQLQDINDQRTVLDVDELHIRLSQIGQHLPEKLEEFLLELQKPIVILLVTADPQNEVALQLDEEHSRMDEAIQSSSHRREFTIHRLPNARPENLIPALRRRRPTIVHFSGHGSGDGLCFVDAVGKAITIDPEVLGRILGEANRKHGLCTAVMSACSSELQGQHVANAVGHLVAFKGAVNDDSALNFSREFYAALGDGLVVEDAFTAAVSGATLTGTDPGSFQPVLLKRDALLLQLLEMGFSRSLSEEALAASGRNGIEIAVSWLEQNGENL